ncbi:MAG: FMN-binding protein [Treponema sp.]|nr:FMN-binding protein [Treponema sp.]
MRWIGRIALLGYVGASLMAAGGCLSGTTQTVPVERGVYEGRGDGYRGTIHVSVQVQSGESRNSLRILDIAILDHQDDPLVGGAAMEALGEAVLESNTTDLDAVSGATESSRGFLAAIDDALRQALRR